MIRKGFVPRSHKQGNEPTFSITRFLSMRQRAMRSLLWLACILHVQAFQVPNALPKLTIRGRASLPVTRSGPLGLFVQPSEGSKPKGTYSLMANQVSTGAQCSLSSLLYSNSSQHSSCRHLTLNFCANFAERGPLCFGHPKERIQTPHCTGAGTHVVHNSCFFVMLVYCVLKHTRS